LRYETLSGPPWGNELEAGCEEWRSFYEEIVLNETVNYIKTWLKSLSDYLLGVIYKWERRFKRPELSFI
jgi:hypothetical protein